jgi:hypothetical protein
VVDDDDRLARPDRLCGDRRDGAFEVVEALVGAGADDY